MELLPALREFGLPVVMLAVCGWWMNKAIIWLANKALLPLVERHVQFIDQLAVVLEAQNERLAGMTGRLDSISATEKENLARNDETAKLLAQILDEEKAESVILERIASSVSRVA